MTILQAYRTVAERASSRLGDRLGAWEPAIAKLLLLCAVVVYLLLAAYIDRPVVDDALISMAYGKTLFTGGGLRVTRYSEIAEGFSNPVWMVLVGGIEGLHLNAISIAKMLGMLLGSASLPVMMLWAPLAQRRQTRGSSRFLLNLEGGGEVMATRLRASRQPRRAEGRVLRRAA